MPIWRHGPTASLKRWGFFFLVSSGLVLSGCAGSDTGMCRPPLDMGYAAAEDSLGLAAFQSLEISQQQIRRNVAGTHVAAANRANRIDYRIGALTTAAGLVPDDPETWLRLARLWRWTGNYPATAISLDNAVVAVGALATGSPLLIARGDQYRKTAGLATALQRAWLHYDRGQWREAKSWVSSALQAEPGNQAAQQLWGLLAGASGDRTEATQFADDLRRKDLFSPDIAWIMSNQETAEGHRREAFNFLLELRPHPRRAAECFRDMGRVAERVGEWAYARRWYRESAAALPYRKITCLREVKHPRISDAAGRHPLPFWLAFERYYVTGSLSSYLAYAYEQFELAADPDQKQMWGGLVVNAAGICLRLGMEKAHVRRVRGLVFARTGESERALTDLRAALREFGAGSTESPRLEAEIGHLLLLQKDYAAAIGPLERSLARNPNSALASSDLGLALIMAGDRDAANKALTRALALDPNLAAAWYNRGLMHLHAGNLDQAEADLAAAARLAPGNVDVTNLLQQVMQKKRLVQKKKD